LAAIVLCAIALIPIRSTFLGPSAAFLGAYGALLMCTELLTALVLASRALEKNDIRMGSLAGAYAFSTILIAANVLALPTVSGLGSLSRTAPWIVSGLGFVSQTAPWTWVLWHVGWGLIVNVFAWRLTPPRFSVRGAIAAAVAASMVCTAVAVSASGYLPVLLLANSMWAGPLWLCYGLAFTIDVIAVIGLLRRVRRLSVLELSVCIAVVAAAIEIALTSLSLVRFSIGFYAGRLFSVVSGIAVFSSLATDLVGFIRRTANEERQNEFRALGEAVPQILWTAGPDGSIEWYNHGWYEYTGQTREEAAGWGWQAVHHPEDFPEVMRRWPDSIATGQPFEMEFRIRGADGEFRWFLTRVRPYRDESGVVVRWFGTNADIDDQKRAVERSLRIAQTLQEVFLPERLPRRDDVAFDAIYVPAASDAFIGGDWYDSLTLPDGRLVISIGDVAGHGLSAAVDAGRLRQIIVSEALNSDDPALILQKADRLLRVQTETIATALVALYDPESGSMTYASAGHPTPILAAPGERARSLPDGGAPLGTGFVEGTHRSHTHVVVVPRDGVVAFYTDGVVELEHDVIAGEARLVAAVQKIVDDDARLSAYDLFHDVLGDRSPQDDVAILLMRRSNGARIDLEPSAPHTTTWRFHSSSAQSARDSRVALMGFMELHAAAGADLFTTELILGELLANTVEHAPGLVEVLVDWTDEQPTIRVRDTGPRFNVPRHGLPENPYAEDGRGLFLVSTLAEDLRIGPAPGFGTEITLRLPLSRTARSPEYAAASSV
jgi:PAS domain S-box-containing protein